MILPAPLAVPPIMSPDECTDDAISRIAQVPGSGDVGADEVAFDEVVRPPRCPAECRVAVGRDDVAGPGRRPADGVARGTRRSINTPLSIVAQELGPGDVGADEVALTRLPVGRRR